MNIILKNIFLYFQNYKLKCSIGKNGISYNKKEGDNKTPKGNFKFKYILYRKDRVLKIKANLKKIIIKKNMGWCDDPNSIYYNKIISKKSDLQKYRSIYDVMPLQPKKFRKLPSAARFFPKR